MPVSITLTVPSPWFTTYTAPVSVLITPQIGCDPTEMVLMKELSIDENTVTLLLPLLTTYILVAPTPVVPIEPATETGCVPTGTAALATVPTIGITLTSLEPLLAIYKLPLTPTPAATCPLVVAGRPEVVTVDNVGSSAI